MTLGEQIRQARENKNLSQEELAEQLGVSRQAVSKWENDTSVPQGMNRELLSQLLEMKQLAGTEGKSDRKRNVVMWLGWGLAGVLLVMLCGSAWLGPQVDFRENPDDMGWTSDTGGNYNPSEGEYQYVPTETPRVKSVQFYDSDQNTVEAVALWYNAAEIDSILIQWAGGSPNNIKVFYTPSGTETAEQTELLMTQAVLDGDTAALLNADMLKEIVQGDVYFELDFGETIVPSELYNVFYDPHVAEY